MNNSVPVEDPENVQNTVEIVLLVWTIFEQFLSFSPESYPKSVSQLVMFIVYRSYRLLKKQQKTTEPDLENQDAGSIGSSRTWRSLVSVNVGP